MRRRVFFSFEYSDVTRAMVVRNCGITAGDEVTGFVDKAEFEKVERQGDRAVMNWINEQLDGTSVTIVLVGANTCISRWVRYEIEQSIDRGNGIFGIDISAIKDLEGNTTQRCGQLPDGYPFYLWFKQDGYRNIGDWIEEAARVAGR